MGIFKKFKSKTPSDLLILYGTKSGNSKLIALQTQKYLEKSGVKSVCKNMSGYKPGNLDNVNKLLVVVSTHGEGDPPPSAKRFFNECFSDSMINLQHLKYSVCALGDSSYQEFCRAGKTLDNRFSELGASSFHPRKDCDLEFSDDAVKWIKQTAKQLNHKKNGNEPVFPNTTFETGTNYTAKITQREALTSDPYVAPVFHIVLNIDSPEIKYKIGDSIEFLPQNPAWLVDAILYKIHNTDSEPTGLDELKKRLTQNYEITSLSKKTLEEYAKTSENIALNKLLASKEELNTYLSNANIYDLITDFYSKEAVQNLPNILPKLKSRMYSIASSQKAFPNELHLTIKTIRFPFNGNIHEGAASVFANEFLKLNSTIEFKICPNEFFQLPPNTSIPLIMIGVSTGIAPFRAMLQEREAMKIKGKTWLIWGNKYKEKNFLYEEELIKFEKNGILEKTNTAFSCDENSFKYVHKIIAAKKDELLVWLSKGAHIYVCGSIKMGNSVKEIFEEITKGTAFAPVNLIKENRWHEDVY